MILLVLLLAGILQEATPLAAAADRLGREQPGRLWNEYPLASRSAAGQPPAAPRTETAAFEPPSPTGRGSGSRIYLTPILIVLAFAFLGAVAFRDVRARRTAAVRRAGQGPRAQSRRGGIRYRD